MARTVGYSEIGKSWVWTDDYPFNCCGERMYECPDCGAKVCILCMPGCDYCGVTIDFTK